jgi:hypothetical protein
LKRGARNAAGRACLRRVRLLCFPRAAVKLLNPDPSLSWRCVALPTQEHIDYLSLQSLLFKQTSLGFVGQLKIFFKHTKRISD